MKTISKYEICGLLGRGGMGKVFKVRLPVIGKIAALKLLDPNPMLVSLMGYESLERLFISEAVTMANLRHPNIAEILDFGQTDGKSFYTMGYYCNNLGTVIGETYRTEEPSRVLDVEKAISYTRQILEGLACLHYAGVIHRDIKPFNILITEQETVKICDFGLSRLRGEKFKGPASLKVGTPWYAAPEQEDNPDLADFTADIYPVGVMLYRMLTGVLPDEPYIGAGRRNPDLDNSWDEFIRRAIAKKSGDRFPGAKAMLKELDVLHSLWRERKEKVCNIPPDEPPESPETTEISSHLLRNRPLKISLNQARKTFPVNDLWQPSHYIRNDFQINGDGTITDRATRLLWEQSGSPYPLTWPQAREYIDKLNKKCFGGYNNWRLPTVDELLSLVKPIPRGHDFCIEPLFDQTQKWLWSADRRSYIAAWYVSTDMGFVSSQDFSAYYYVRGCLKFDA